MYRGKRGTSLGSSYTTSPVSLFLLNFKYSNTDMGNLLTSFCSFCPLTALPFPWPSKFPLGFSYKTLFFDRVLEVKSGAKLIQLSRDSLDDYCDWGVLENDFSFSYPFQIQLLWPLFCERLIRRQQFIFQN